MIVASGLSKRYRRTTALRDLTVALPAGGVTALVGPNGAGKSTLLKLCVGFERASAGRIAVLGVDPARDRAGAVAKVGYVPQAPSLYRDLTAEDHLQLASSLRQSFDITHARSRLRSLGIPLSATPGQLSGGQQAQISLAIALGTRAAVLLLDEPLANLDPLARREFLQVVTEEVAGGDVSAVLSSHVISDVEPVCDRLLVLGEGRVLLHDTVAAAISAHHVTDDSAQPETGAIVARFPDRSGVLHRLIRTTVGLAEGRQASLEEVVLGYLASARIAA
jgi:ABC-2 type transport system ATP-binding protein